MSNARVTSVSRDERHRFSKPSREEITLVEGLGVEGDAHFGATVQHLFDKRRGPQRPNLRQVHLIHEELFDEVTADVDPGDLGENVTTSGIDLLSLPRGARLRLGDDAVVEVTGLRNPCTKIDRLEAGLMKQLVTRDAAGTLVQKTGVMAIVLTGGVVRPGDAIEVELPAEPREALRAV